MLNLLKPIQYLFGIIALIATFFFGRREGSRKQEAKQYQEKLEQDAKYFKEANHYRKKIANMSDSELVDSIVSPKTKGSK